MTVENGTASNKTRLWEGSNGIDLRAYNGSSLSFSVPSGHVITKMTFTGGKVADDLFATVTGEYSSKVWSGSANPVVLEILGTVNVETITIEYGLGEPEAPKTKQELSFPEASYSIVMGEPFTAPVLSGAMTDVTYSSSKEEVATVGDNGAVTLVGPGTTVITATAAADETYASASASYTLIVSPAPSSSLLSLPWNEDFSGDLSSYTILNGGGTTAIQTSGTMYAGGEGNELLIAKGNGSLAAKISTGGYTGTLTLTFKSNHADYLEVTSETSGVEVYKNTDTEYIINISKSMDTFVITLTNVKSSNTRVDDISMVKGGNIPEINIPTYASLSALVAAGAPTAEGTKVTVTLTNEKITGIYTTSSGYRNGVFLQVGEQEIEIYSKNVPDAWVEGGTISGTLTECDWKLYNTTWELCPDDWSELTYTAPEEPEVPGTGGGENAEPATLIIDGSTLTTTSTTMDSDHDFGEVTLTMSKGAKSQNSGAATNAFSKNPSILIGKSGAYIYNKTPIPGKIIKFEIYANAGASQKVSVGVNFSSTQINSYNSSASNTFTATLSTTNSVYDCSDKLPDNAQYFWYQVTNSNNSQVQFRITYIPAN